MKKYIGILLFSFLLLSCDKIDDKIEKLPPFAADLDGAITNAKTAELALLGVYSNIPAGYNNYLTTAAGSFKAGTMRRPEWWSRGNAVYFYERYWPYLYASDKDWDYDYNIIKNANFLLTAIDGIDDFEENRGDEIKGELHFLRAFAYERLMLRYAQYWDMSSALGLIIRNDLPNITQIKKERSTVAESYQMILDELNLAIDLCPDYSFCGQASKVAAKAYKTRVLFQMGEYSDCITMADEVIAHTDNALSPDYATNFTDWESSNEILFGRVYASTDMPNLESRLNAYGNALWGPSPNYLALLGDDPRAGAIIGPEIEVEYRYGANGLNHSVKKLLNSSNDLPLIFMRTAEVYLLKAEAIYRNGGSYDDAYAAIEVIRNRAGADPVPHATQEEIEAAILNEWLIEMSFENAHEWFALRRFGVEKLLERNDLLRASFERAVAKGSAEEAEYRLRMDNFRIVAIPSSETNSNPVTQNPGY